MTRKQALNILNASTTLRLETLETRNSDRLDFHTLSVEDIFCLIETAEIVGCKRGLNESRQVLADALTQALNQNG